MSEVVEGTPRGIVAGNTVETLAPKSVDAVVSDEVIAEIDNAPEAPAYEPGTPVTVVDGNTVLGTGSVLSVSPAQVEADEEDPLDDENTFDVSRAEFKELQDAFLRLSQRIDKHNQGAPHKI